MDNLFDTLAKATKQPAGKTAVMPQPAAEQTVDFDKMPMKDLVKRWQVSQDKELASKLLARLRPTIASALSTYAPNNPEKMEIKAAKLALDALRSYNPDKGAEPSTYVFGNLRRLYRLSTKSSNIIPQSEGFMADSRRLNDLISKFEDRKDREPSIAELSDMSGFSAKKVENILAGNMTVVNESATLSEDSKKDTLSQSTLTDEDYFKYVYSSVSPKDQKIMEWSSGLTGKPVMSNNDIARKLKISPAAVSQRKYKIQKLLSDVRGLV